MNRYEDKHGATVQGVREAWDFWIDQHDVTVPECIVAAIKDAFRGWLDDHEDEIIAAIASNKEQK